MSDWTESKAAGGAGSRGKQAAFILLIGINLIVALYMTGTLMSVYMGVIADDIGVPRSLLSLNGTLRYIIAFGLNLCINVLIRKIGLKRLILIGLLSGILFLFLFTTAQTLPMFYLAGAVGGLCSCFSGIVPVALLIRYCFPQSQGTVLAITSSMTGVAGVTITPLLSQIVKVSDWRTGFRVLALVAVVIFLLELFFLKVPEGIGQEENTAGHTEVTAGKKETIRVKNRSHTGSFVSMILMSALFTVGALCLYTNAAVVLQEIGFSQTFATGTAVSLISLFNIIGKFVIGRLCDRGNAGKIMIAWYALCVACSVYFMIDRTPSLSLAIPGLIMIGIIGGIYSVPIPFIGARLFPDVEEYTRVVGFCTAASNLSGAFSGLLFHGVYDGTGSYMYSLLYITVLSVINVGIVCMLMKKCKQM